MKKLKIWFWVVGIFYLLLTCMNLGILFLSPESMGSELPEKYQSIPESVMSFSDAWLVFVFELGVLGAFCIVAAQNPLKHTIMAWVVIFAEIFRGIVADLIWIFRGYDPSGYIVFIIIHAAIIITGFLFVRNSKSLAYP